MILTEATSDKDEAVRRLNSWRAGTGRPSDYRLYRHKTTRRYLVVSSGTNSEPEQKLLNRCDLIPMEEEDAVVIA